MHVTAILREFRGPILAFFMATFGGGALYGELFRSIRGEMIPWIDRPYMMLQLMLLEAPGDVPAEAALVVFWYAMPLIFIVLVTLGAADFLDLFFNRDEARDRWSEAIAMTFRNHIIVLGVGHVGLRVVRDLHDLGLDVAVVDSNPHPDARDTLERLGVPCILTNVRERATLDHAGLDHADCFVACTGDDRLNLEMCMKVRERNEHVRIVARIWDRAIGDRMEKFGLADSVMSAADLSAPAFAGAAAGVEITQTIEVAGTEYSTARVDIVPGSFMEGVAIGTVERENELEVTLLRTGEGITVDPDEAHDLRAGETVVVFAEHARVLDVVARNRGAGRRG
jgi:Trk K+ transport system NAD-binding subunit